MARCCGVFGKIMQSEKGILSFLMGIDRYDGLKKSCDNRKDRLISIAAILPLLKYVLATRGSVQQADHTDKPGFPGSFCY